MMSINFDDPMGEEAKKLISQKFKMVAALDDKKALIDEMREIHQKDLKEIANAAGQTCTVELNEEGEIKTMSDGTRYRCTAQGWRKIEEEEKPDEGVPT